MDARDEMARLIAWLVQNVDDVESNQIKADIALLLGAAGQMVTVLANRNTTLAKQYRSRKAKAPKTCPAKGPQQRKDTQRSTDTPKTQNAAQKQPEELSHIQQGIRQAGASMADQQRAIRQQIYGQQNREVAFQKAAKAIAS